jgi:hypothetical protein
MSKAVICRTQSDIRRFQVTAPVNEEVWESLRWPERLSYGYCWNA